MKKEYIYLKEYAKIEMVEKDIFYYVEIFYNRKRMNSSLGYLSPVAYRLKNLNNGVMAENMVCIRDHFPLIKSIPVQILGGLKNGIVQQKR